LKGILTVSVIASVLILSVGLSQDVFAPPPEKAEKIHIDDTSWDDESQTFTISHSAQFGMASAGENTDFTASTALTLDLGGTSVTLTGERDLKKVDGATKDSDNMIAIEPTVIPWDRNGGTFSGTASVTASSQIINPSGGTVGNSATSLTETVEIGTQVQPSLDATSTISRDGFVRSLDQGGTDCNPIVETKPFFNDNGITMSVQMFKTDFRHCNFSYVEWDTSGIPDGATITNTVIKFDVTSVSNPSNCNYIDMGATQPTTATAQEILTAILVDGSHYVADDPACTAIGSGISVDLGTTANADLQNQLVDDYFAVGIEFSGIRDTEDHSISIATSEDTSATTIPTLEITYTP